MAAHHSRIGRNAGATRQPESAGEMCFSRRANREAFRTFQHFDHALFAFSLFAAGCRNFDAQGFRGLEQGSAGQDIGMLVIKMQLDTHAAGFWILEFWNLIRGLNITNNH
jgi:hypothetical protein